MLFEKPWYENKAYPYITRSFSDTNLHSNKLPLLKMGNYEVVLQNKMFKFRNCKSKLEM